MTLTNGATGVGGGTGNFAQMPAGFDPTAYSATANMQILLQTNNDLILAIHKALVESNQETNRKIESLRDDIRDIKLNLQKNDNTLKDEANNWRNHVALLLGEQGDRHLQDSIRLQDMLMKLVIGQPPVPVVTTTIATAPPPPPVPAVLTSTHPPTSTATTTVISGPSPSLFDNKPPQFEPGAVSAAPTPATTAPPAATALGPKNFTFKQAEPTGFKPATPPVPTTTITSSTTTSSTTFGGFMATSGQNLFGGGAKTGTNQAEPAGFKPATPPVATTTGTTSSTTFGGGFTATSGQSLFGGGAKTGTNSFANLAAKASETGGGLFGGGMGSGSGGKPTFGASPFGSAGKLFSSPNASARNLSKGADDSIRGGGDESDKEEEEPEDYTPDAHHEPVVDLSQLPEVEVVSGEEGEEVVFVTRCKLFRYDREVKQNKERGLGDIKILKNPATDKYRCVMRREKVFKLCANFPILGNLKVHQREGDNRVYTWDFSEDPAAGTDETFSAKFKDAAIAKEFGEKMNEAIDAMK